MPAALSPAPQAETIPDDTKVILYWNHNGLHKLGFFIRVNDKAPIGQSHLICIANGAWAKRPQLKIPPESLAAYHPVKQISFEPTNDLENVAGEYGLVPVSTDFASHSGTSGYLMIWVWFDIHHHFRATKRDFAWNNTFTGILALNLLRRLTEARGDLSKLSLETEGPHDPAAFQWDPQPFESVL